MARAVSAFHRSCKRHGYLYQQPAAASSGVQEHAGKHYAVLRNGQGMLQVYRVRNDGMLKALKRWPKALEDY